MCSIFPATVNEGVKLYLDIPGSCKLQQQQQQGAV